MLDLYDLIKKFIDQSILRRVDIISHPSADIDSIASAIALSLVIRSVSNPEICYLAPPGLDPVAKRVMTYIEGKGLLKLCNDFAGEILFIVDASSCSRVDAPCDKYQYVVVIDHHSIVSVDERNINVIDPSSTSSTEIILKIFRSNNIVINDTDLLDIFLSAILYETGLLTNYTEDTNENIKWLIEQGASLSKALQVIRRDLRYDEKIARLKGLARIRVYRTYDRKIICLTHISAHESLVASQMISAGCDLAIVVADKDHEKWIVARCNENICSDKNLGEIFINDIINRYNGSWGGHDKAAVAKIPMKKLDIEALFIEILNILRIRLGEIEKIDID